MPDYETQSRLATCRYFLDRDPVSPSTASNGYFPTGLGWYPWHQANCGDLDLCGFKRPQSYYRDVLWQSSAELHIAVHPPPAPEGKTTVVTYWGWPDVWPNWTWPGREGQPFKVDVYSACEKVELFLNDKSLGVQPTTRQERFACAPRLMALMGQRLCWLLVMGEPSSQHRFKLCFSP